MADERCSCWKCRNGTGCIRSFVVPASATPTRKQSKGRPRAADPAWERGVAGEDRPDGSFMPYVNSTGTHIGVKEYADKRGRYEEHRKAVGSGYIQDTIS